LLVVVAGCRFGFDRLAPDGTQDDARVIDAGAPESFVPYWRSGTRMRARLLVPVDGGDPYWFGWRDTQLGMDCTNGVAADGAERCVHTEIAATKYYADAGCSVPLAWLRPRSCGSGTHAYDFDGGGRFRAYPIGTLHTGPVYGDVGTCGVVSAPEGTLHLLGTEVPAASLIAAQYTREPVGVYERYIQGLVDGAGVELGTLETPGGSCAPAASGLGPSACIPNVRRATAAYLDPACTQRVYFWDRQSYDPPTISQFAELEPVACNSSFTHHAVVSDVTAATYYRQTPAGCTSASTGARGTLYPASPLADPVPLGSSVIGPRRGRLGYLYWIGPDDQALAVRYWDHDLGMPCLPINGTDDKLRCLPVELAQITASVDATCTGAPQSLTPACFPGTPVDGPDYTSCSDTYTVQTLPNVTTTASLFGDSCSPLTLASGFYDVSSPGAAIEPAMFAELTEIIE
jgi:hypothetical protein